MNISVQDILDLAQPLAWMSQPFQGFCLDSRKVESGQVFIALNSYSQPEKTLLFAQAALAKGAIGIIAETALAVDNCWVCPQARLEMGKWQKRYLDATQPTHPLHLFAVTGTNGKTTISRLIAELVSLQGQACAVMGTTGNGILPHLEASTHTTLDAIQLQNALHQYAQQGAKFAALEASSHGLEQGRLQGAEIEIAVYSNLSRDHLDYHKTIEAYAEAKAQLFAFPSLKTAIINLDDDYAQIMLAQAQNNPAKPTIWTYALENQQADFYVSELSFSLQGARFNLHTPQGVFSVQSPLLGHFNVENLVASLIAVFAAGFDFAAFVASVPQLQGAPGRMQVLRDQDKLFVVDYAHTPDALIQVLTSLQRHVEQRLWAVFGCGGDRDRGKRPLMTLAALAHANPVILTSDNPRTENPEQIFADMKKDIDFSAHDMYEIHDRRAAIRFAVAQAQAGDIVVIAGKGHENYQEIDGVRHWFDDVVEVDAAIHHQGEITAHSALEN
ncbi:UDP-N-acetylmuramoyl-L-alanyl-D-glutamate--2,6-diaminopimelate ligase [Acinetobacter sp. MD2(2019)]|uniref:UDP-N-acetylmuramoyl-L-alanyl-D-glutamate--2, 6-diaminopimelate ligase n=1 Tax=Acinetobacter sp. MD2(2019) TaxID=2605273 RepID=UPI002D1EC884|nr:UDP-N-acetylmuramoyl-L-alanyl-D-glutamate--2,6-diaminopimelate ligase [Acinetobacter sp. MD2(2019)]MEB3754329.1 UDP-N-acetylmuramoyl-L-alanyl-D-glutamate--2,6-diaminopimelate ligase [Acinetobacter sp. MD2(2019)]